MEGYTSINKEFSRLETKIKRLTDGNSKKELLKEGVT